MPPARSHQAAALIKRLRPWTETAPITRPAILLSGEITSVLGKSLIGIKRRRCGAGSGAPRAGLCPWCPARRARAVPARTLHQSDWLSRPADAVLNAAD